VSQSYSYTKANFSGLQAPYTAPSTGRLRRDVINDPAVPDTKALLSLIWNVGTEEATFTFSSALSGAEETALAGLVSAHTGEPLASTPLEVCLAGVDHSQGRMPSANFKPDVNSDPVVSHNWCKPESWWAYAVQKTEVSCNDVSLSQDPVADARTVWTPAPGYNDAAADPPERTEMINLRWGQVSTANMIPSRTSYYPVVEVDTGSGWVVQTEEDKDEAYETQAPSNDYAIDYANALITFHAALPEGASVRVSFWVPTSSAWVLFADPGKIIRIDEVEVQFSTDVGIRDTFLFKTRLGDTETNLATPREYPTLGAFVDEANRHYHIPARDIGHWRGQALGCDVHAWDYKGLKSMTSQAYEAAPGVWLPVKLTIQTENHKPAAGMRATVTVYVIEEDL